MITIRQTQIEDASKVAACIDSVAREKRFLANTVGFSVEQTADYIKFIKNAGFLEEGRKRNARKLNDQYDDIILFGLLRKEWLG